MIKLVQRTLLLLLLVVFFSNCRKKAFDEFYGRPESLAAPIYQQLQAKGKFKNLLACIDKAGYTATLSAAGYWTLFAPNDSAFQQFFTQRGIADISKLDSGTCKQIVTYGLVYNAFAKARLGDYQSAAGWVPNMAFKRRTANYIGYYDDTTFTGQKVKALSSNRNGGFITGDNNNKNIPYFLDNFLGANRLTSADYNYFYPGTTYLGFNVVDAKVVTQDIVAENGFIHEIDKVILPLPNFDQYLASNPQYSEFKKLFDKYMVQFVLSADATARYKLLGGNSDVYIKGYNAGLAFSLNNENFLKLQDNDAQASGYTMFVPTNDVLKNYINTVLLENYTSLDQMPLQIIVDFLNAHMWQGNVWPSKFTTTNNFQGEPARFDATTDVIDKKILSNGIFYGTNKVQQANVFTTVYGRVYLDPNYLLMLKILNTAPNYGINITIPTIKYTVVMMSDAVIKSFGYDYNNSTLTWQYSPPGSTTIVSGNAARDALLRIVATHIIPTPNGEMDNLTDSGIVESLNGEYVKYNKNKFISAGSQDSGFTISATGTKTSINGRVYYADKLLTYTTRTIGSKIVSLGGTSAANSDYYNFAQLLKSSTLYNVVTGDILGVSPGVFYTVFVPNNAAIQAAATAGWLPKLASGQPNLTNNPAWSQGAKDSINSFILFHILNKNTVVPDGKKTGTFETLYKKVSTDPGTLRINSAPKTMQVTDNYGRVSNVLTPKSNNLADRCVIHLIDNYLQYNPY